MAVVATQCLGIEKIVRDMSSLSEAIPRRIRETGNLIEWEWLLRVVVKWQREPYCALRSMQDRAADCCNVSISVDAWKDKAPHPSSWHLVPVVKSSWQCLLLGGNVKRLHHSRPSLIFWSPIFIELELKKFDLSFWNEVINHDIVALFFGCLSRFRTWKMFFEMILSMGKLLGFLGVKLLKTVFSVGGK